MIGIYIILSSKDTFCCLAKLQFVLHPKFLKLLIAVIKIRTGNIILFIESETSAELHAQPGGNILIASRGEETVSHESLKNQELQHSGSKTEYLGDLMEGREYVSVSL